jgi:hypothetical protein
MTARPAPAGPTPERVVVVGCAGSGETTLARSIAARLDARHIERNALGDDEAPGFAVLVAAAVEAAGPRWVFDGAPYNAEALVYPHADALVALDYPRRVVWRRVHRPLALDAVQTCVHASCARTAGGLADAARALEVGDARLARADAWPGERREHLAL